MQACDDSIRSLTRKFLLRERIFEEDMVGIMMPSDDKLLDGFDRRVFFIVF